MASRHENHRRLPGAEIEHLDHIARAQNVSRAEVMRRAVTAYTRQKAEALPMDAFGLWRDREVDGLALQRSLRAEWHREWEP